MPTKNPSKNNTDSRIFGLIGSSLRHSFSSNYFQSKFEKANLSDCFYLNFEIPEASLILEVLEDHPLVSGLNVTIPYKEDILPFLSLITEDARNIGAVNTIKVIRGRKSLQLIGYNSDWKGFLNAYSTVIKKHSKAFILGTGGASKAIQYALQHADISFQIVSRTPKNGYLAYDHLDENKLVDALIINTTPLGMYPDKHELPPLPLKLIKPENTLIDLIYNPEETLLMKACKKQGAEVHNGYDMLVEQAEISWKIWNE